MGETIKQIQENIGNRKIEFRAWNKCSQTMANDPAQQEGASECVYLSDFFFNDELIMMQFTGLLDKNGTKIFEGDVVKDIRAFPTNFSHSLGDSQSGAINYNTKLGGLFVNTDYFQGCDCKNFEIIGNVFENPELLNLPE